MAIPIVIGATGSCDLQGQDRERLRATVRGELARLREACPHSPFVLLSALTTNSDLLCAQEALALGMRLVCSLPLRADRWRQTFAGEDLDAFDDLIFQASEVFVVPSREPGVSGHASLSRRAARSVAAHCHVLLALVCGSPTAVQDHGIADGTSGGGHAQAFPGDVDEDGAIIRICVSQPEPGQTPDIDVRLTEEQADRLSETLARTDAFNADCATLAPDDQEPEGRVSRLRSTYDSADRLSLQFQNRYLRALWTLSLFCVLLVLAFLLYDEASLRFMLLVWGGLAVAYAICYRLVLRGRYHQKYLHYRVLAEVMRVQSHLSSLGIEANVGDDFTWTQRHDVAWVRKAVGALLVGAPEGPSATPEEARVSWIDDQHDYHVRAGARDAARRDASDTVTRVMLGCAILTYLAIIVGEYGFPEAMAHTMLGLQMQAWGKIALGVLASVTLFVSGYYGHLSFERKAFDHERMAQLFAAAGSHLDRNPASPEGLFRALAREEVIENGNWLSYCKENRPDFSL